MNRYTITIRREYIFLLSIALMLGIGLALALPAHGSALAQTEPASGEILGKVTVGGQGTGGITVELRQRANDGTDTLLATTTTDPTGIYRFAGQPGAPNNAFYYIKVTGGKGTLAVWYTFPIIYVQGSAFTVPEVEMADIQITAPAQNAVINLPAKLSWKARRAGETYRLFVYAGGAPDKVALDSGSLGTASEFTIPADGLPEGKYEAVVQVRDAVAGYGQGQTHLRFTVSKAAPLPSGAQGGQEGQGSSGPESQTGGNPPANTQTNSQNNNQTNNQGSGQGSDQSSPPGALPELEVNLSANKTSVWQGDNMVYTIEVTNSGRASAQGVVVNDTLPSGLVVDAAGLKSTPGSASVQGNTVTVNVGTLEPGAKALIQIPVSVSQSVDRDTALSNQASVLYQGATDPVRSNAYIAQVIEPMAGEPPVAGKEAVPQQEAGSGQNQQVSPSQGAAEQAPQNSESTRPQPQSQGQNQSQSQSQSQSQQPAGPQPGSPSSTEGTEGQSTRPQPAQQQSAGQQPQSQSQPQPGASAIPDTGGAFPVVLAAILMISTLLARYLRGRTPRRF